jgi:hypothetical protein
MGDHFFFWLGLAKPSSAVWLPPGLLSSSAGLLPPPRLPPPRTWWCSGNGAHMEHAVVYEVHPSFEEVRSSSRRHPRELGRAQVGSPPRESATSDACIWSSFGESGKPAAASGPPPAAHIDLVLLRRTWRHHRRGGMATADARTSMQTSSTISLSPCPGTRCP